jgi:hypothetical protein
MMRATSAVEWESVPLPDGPAELASLIDRSKRGQPREFPEARSAFLDFMGGVHAALP